MKQGPFRVPGMLEATLLDDRLATELIADLRQVSPDLMRLALKAKAERTICFVTDAMRQLDPWYRAGSVVGLCYGCGPTPLLFTTALDPERSFAVVPIRLRLANETGYPHKGYIDFVDNRVNTATGTLRVRGLFWNHDRVLSPGFFVRVRVPISPPHKALMVTDKAVVTDQDQKVLYVLNDKETYGQINALYKLDSGVFESVKFGARFASHERQSLFPEKNGCNPGFCGAAAALPDGFDAGA